MEAVVKIRAAVINDLDTIFNFISHLEEALFDEESFEERFRKNLDDPNVIYLVSVNERDELTGFISAHGKTLLHHEGRVFEIEELCGAQLSRAGNWKIIDCGARRKTWSNWL